MKKVLLIICTLLLALIIFAILYREDPITIMSHEKYKDIIIDDIESIEYIRYTEGGSDSRLIEDKEEIIKTYNYLNSKRIGKETDQACEDNTKVYKFNLSSSPSISIEIECDWIIIGNERYILE